MLRETQETLAVLAVVLVVLIQEALSLAVAELLTKVVLEDSQRDNLALVAVVVQ